MRGRTKRVCPADQHEQQYWHIDAEQQNDQHEQQEDGLAVAMWVSSDLHLLWLGPEAQDQHRVGLDRWSRACQVALHTQANGVVNTAFMTEFMNTDKVVLSALKKNWTGDTLQVELRNFLNSGPVVASLQVQCDNIYSALRTLGKLG